MKQVGPLITSDYQNKIYYTSGEKQVCIGVAGKKANRIDYSLDDYTDRKNEKRFLSEILGIEKNAIVMVKQLHKDSIITLDKVPDNNDVYFAEGDAIITSVPNICLVIRSADCVPVFIYDKKNNILGAVHSGWRGCQLSISLKVLKRMVKNYGTEKEDVEVFILPSIGPESYTIGQDVAALFKDDIIHDSDKIFLNMWKNIEESLNHYGVSTEQIHNSQICTMKNQDEFFSYRNKDNGRNLNFSYLIP